jgi:hypothetical protein
MKQPEIDMAAMNRTVQQVAETCERMKLASADAARAINAFTTALTEPFYNMTYAELKAWGRGQP